MKTIMYVLTDVFMGGSAWALLDMLREMADRVRPVVIIPGKGLTEERLKQLKIQYYIIPFKVKFCKIGTGSPRLDDSVFKGDYEAALRLLPVIDEEKVDLIHTNSSISNVGAIAAVLANKPHVWHLRELLEEHFDCEFPDRDFKRELLKCTEEFIAISDCVKKIYERKFGISTVRVYDGLDLEQYLREEVYRDRGHTFLLAGIINDGKGQWDAVRAAEMLVSRGVDDIRLTIVGNGDQKTIWSMKKYIMQKGLDRNIFVRPFRENLYSLREEHTYSLTCSKMEALGRTTIEAILSGNIVIGADTGGTLEILGEDGERGYLYRQGDYKNLAQVMYDVMCAKPQEKIGKSRLARELVKRTFHLEKYAMQVEELYDAVVGGYKTEEQKERRTLRQRMKRRYESLRHTEEKPTGTEEKKFETMFKYTELWLRIKQQGYTLADFFTQRGAEKIAVYGMGFLGCDLYDELEEAGIEIAYVMDKQPQTIDKIVPVVNADENLPCVDAIVVTAISIEEKIREWLQSLCPYPIIGLTEILESYREKI